MKTRYFVVFPRPHWLVVVLKSSYIFFEKARRRAVFFKIICVFCGSMSGFVFRYMTEDKMYVVVVPFNPLLLTYIVIRSASFFPHGFVAYCILRQ